MYSFCRVDTAATATAAVTVSIVLEYFLLYYVARAKKLFCRCRFCTNKLVVDASGAIGGTCSNGRTNRHNPVRLIFSIMITSDLFRSVCHSLVSCIFSAAVSCAIIHDSGYVGLGVAAAGVRIAQLPRGYHGCSRSAVDNHLWVRAVEYSVFSLCNQVVRPLCGQFMKE